MESDSARPLIPNSLTQQNKSLPDQLDLEFDGSQNGFTVLGYTSTPPETLLHLEEHIVDLIVGEWAVSHRGGKMHLKGENVN